MNPTLEEPMRRISGLLRAGNYRDAHADLLTIVAANPEFIEGLRLLAATHQALGDAAAAEALLRRALAIDPTWPPTLTTLAELLLTAGRSAEAEPLLKRAATGNSVLPRAVLVLARHYNLAGRPQEALSTAEPLCLTGRAEPDLAAQHIGALAALGRQAEAVEFYRKLAVASPNNPAAAHALVIALTTTNQTEAATRIAAQALQRGYRSPSLLSLYARNLSARGALAEAEVALRQAVELDPLLIDAHNNLANLIWMRTGDIAQATATLDAALNRFGDDDALRAAKAALLQGSGDARAAYACLAEPAARAQAPPMFLLRAGLAALEFDPATALGLAERALRGVPTNAAARSLRAAACLGIGDAHAALAQLESLLAQSPDDQYLIALQTTAWRLLGDARYGELCDYAKLVLPQQIEVPQGWPNLASFLDDLKMSLDRLHSPHGHPLLFQSLRHGTETTEDLAVSKDRAISALFGAFAAPIERYLQHIGQGADPLRRRNQGRWRFNGSWSVRLHSSGYHTNHVHPRGWLSSAFYIELPDSMRNAKTSDGELTFGEPGIVTSPPLAAEYSVRPQVGMLALFPSYVWHGTVPFHSDQPRLTVAFDVVPQK